MDASAMSEQSDNRQKAGSAILVTGATGMNGSAIIRHAPCMDCRCEPWSETGRRPVSSVRHPGLTCSQETWPSRKPSRPPLRA